MVEYFGRVHMEKNISSILICYTKHNIRYFSSAGSVALALQARGRRFESYRDHQNQFLEVLLWNDNPE